MGKSRSNLRGWIFRVAHNLALKQRIANQRWQVRVEAERDADSMQDAKLNPEEQLLLNQRQRRLLVRRDLGVRSGALVASKVGLFPKKSRWRAGSVTKITVIGASLAIRYTYAGG